ncbi:hypothetical protein K8T06_01420 [bacterium]|nr:hypothetical protein [bacterium]
MKTSEEYPFQFMIDHLEKSINTIRKKCITIKIQMEEIEQQIRERNVNLGNRKKALSVHSRSMIDCKGKVSVNWLNNQITQKIAMQKLSDLIDREIDILKIDRQKKLQNLEYGEGILRDVYMKLNKFKIYQEKFECMIDSNKKIKFSREEQSITDIFGQNGFEL